MCGGDRAGNREGCPCAAACRAGPACPAGSAMRGRRRGVVTPPYGRAAEYAAGGTMWASSPTECNKKCGGWVVGDADPYGCAARSAAVYAGGQRRPPLHRAGKLVWAAGHMGPALQGLYALTAGGVEPRPYGAVNDRIS